MERLAKFIRSVIPGDRTQLLILAGAICLTVSPHLRFWPPEFITLPGHRTEPLIEQTAPLSVFFVYFVLFSGMAAYFVCFWPGRHPIRRILLSVFAPAIAGSGFFLAQIFWFTQAPTSVLQSRYHVMQSIRSFDWTRWISLPGFFFCFAGLLLIAIYASRLAFGIAYLPLSLPGSPLNEASDSDSWHRLQGVIWVLIGPLIFVYGLVFLLTFVFPWMLLSRIPAYTQTAPFNNMVDAVGAVAMFAILLWVMGKENRQVVWDMARFPKLRFAALGLSIPIGIATLISAGQYLLARMQWTAHGFGTEAPPAFASFFKVPDPWLYLLIFSALFEELIFRGLLQRRFTRRYGVYRGIFLVGIVWAAFHFHSDISFSNAAPEQVLTILGSRVAMCLVLNYVLGWLTLRFSSVVPAALAHAFYNVLVFSEFGPSFSGKSVLRLGLWAVLAWLLFRYWPIRIEREPDPEIAIAAPNPEPAV